MLQKRYLTKSKFKLAMECPTKLFYTGKSDYPNQTLDDSFLLALADGGFQVGELAKKYFPGGFGIATLDYEQAMTRTNNLLKQKRTIIYEAAISTGNFFVRIDILVKNGHQFSFYEVKAKSFNSEDEKPFLNKNGTIKSVWKPYLYDVAFQKYVINKAFPQYDIKSFLILADKSAKCPTEGLNQKFRLIRDKNGKKYVSMPPFLNNADLTPPILCEVNVDTECKQIYEKTYNINNQVLSFTEKIELFAKYYYLDKKIYSPVTTACAKCEFYTTNKNDQKKFKSGKKECWKQNLGWSNKDFNSATVLDIWNFRKKGKLIESNRIKMTDVVRKDILPKPDKKPGISASERQWLQVKKYQTKDSSIWIDCDGLKDEIDSWVFPLHFIDFETAMIAIPFNKGRHPYEGIAFQFSHHIANKDGTVEHRGEYLNTKQGQFPNYDFLRHLKSQLEKDQGSIFCYSKHENTFLNIIYGQLRSDKSEIKDKEELCNFIKSITQSVKDSIEQWLGQRNMIDMWKIVKRYYYDPITNGSNSIKQILPAILNSSKYLQKKYSKPLYGAHNGIKSLNFDDWQWIRFDSLKIKDPYKLLPKMFQDVTEKDMLILSNNDDIRSGGAALTAYARMQFEHMSNYERKEINTALLKYCELDTMAMVMIYEGWKDLIQQEQYNRLK